MPHPVWYRHRASSPCLFALVISKPACSHARVLSPVAGLYRGRRRTTVGHRASGRATSAGCMADAVCQGSYAQVVLQNPNLISRP